MDEVSEDKMCSKSRSDREQINSGYLFFKAIDNQMCAREYKRLALERTIPINPERYNLKIKMVNLPSNKRIQRNAWNKR